MDVGQELEVGAQEARSGLRDLTDAALERNQRTVITRNGRPVAVLVPYDWYIERVREASDA